MQANIPDAWVGQRAAIQYKRYSREADQPWGVATVQGTITEKNDVGIVVAVVPNWPAEGSTMLITYDALLTVDV